MDVPVKPVGSDRFPRRRQRARATRRRVLDAARELFVERGYVQTTIAAIAQCADVAPETVYATFGSKRALLSELVDVAISGDPGDPPLLEQDWVRDLRDEPDAHRRVRTLAGRGRAILERRAAIDEVVRGAAAADPEIAELWRRGRVQRFAGQRALAAIVIGGAVAPDDAEVDRPADVLYAIGSPEVYRLLVMDRGWTPGQFERWYAETLERLLLAPVAPG